MPPIAIRLITEKPQEIFGLNAYIGEIAFGNFKESFYMPLNWWTLQDYKKQWQDGLNRLKHESTSCLVVSVQGPQEDPLLNIWALYKEGKKIVIQNHLLTGNIIFNHIFRKNNLNEFNFSVDTCYNYITPRDTIAEDGNQISEWVVPLNRTEEKS